MLKHIYLILIATFLFGFITGFLLWLMNHTGDEVDSNPTVDKSLSIAVHAYGGCDSVGCASYRIEDGGAYTYIIRSRTAPEQRTEGQIPRTERSTIESLIEKTNFEELDQSTFTGTCPIAFDGLAYRYIISYEGNFYTLDSCQHELGRVPLFEMLMRYFIVFQNSDRGT